MNETPKHYYAGRNTYGTNFAFSADNGWEVYEFDSKQNRNDWIEMINTWSNRNGNGPQAEIVSRKIASKIMGAACKHGEPVTMSDMGHGEGEIIGHKLVHDPEVYGWSYWS